MFSPLGTSGPCPVIKRAVFRKSGMGLNRNKESTNGAPCSEGNVSTCAAEYGTRLLTINYSGSRFSRVHGLLLAFGL